MAESTANLTYDDLAYEVHHHNGFGNVYGTGTLTVVSGVCTLASGTVPSWAANGVCQIDANFYTVNTRDGATQFTLDDTSVNEAAGTEYVLFEGTESGALETNHAIRNGLNRFYRRHNWTFLKPTTTLTLTAEYSTGTIGIASGVVTLTGGTFSSDVQNNPTDFEITVEGNTYAVSTYDSATQVTLSDTSVTVTAGATYSLGRPTYTLPDDFAYLVAPFTYRHGQAVGRAYIDHLAVHQILSMRQQHVWTGTPYAVAVRPTSFTASTGQRFQALFYPTPDTAFVVNYDYAVRHNMINPTNKYARGGVEHAQTLLSACMAAADRLQKKDHGYDKDFERDVLFSIEHDKRLAPSTFGYNGDGSANRRSRARIPDYLSAPPTYVQS